MFKRLHHRGEYEGSGIGLAIVKLALFFSVAVCHFNKMPSECFSTLKLSNSTGVVAQLAMEKLLESLLL